MRLNGFTWQTNRVTQLETLRRPVALLEVAGLSWVFDVQVSVLLAGDDLIEVSNGHAVPLSDIRDGLTGAGGMKRGSTASQRSEAAFAETGKMAARLGVSIPVLDWCSQHLYGRGFFEERDRRAGDLSTLGKRSAQT